MDNPSPSPLQLPQLALSSDQLAILDAHIAQEIGAVLQLEFNGNVEHDMKFCYAFTHHRARFLMLHALKTYDAEMLKNLKEQTNA